MIFVFVGVLMVTLALDFVLPQVPFSQRAYFSVMMIVGMGLVIHGINRMFAGSIERDLRRDVQYYRHLYNDLVSEMMKQNLAPDCDRQGHHHIREIHK